MAQESDSNLKINWKTAAYWIVALITIGFVANWIWQHRHLDPDWTIITGIAAVITGLAAAGAFIFTAITTIYNYRLRQRDEKRHKKERSEDLESQKFIRAWEIVSSDKYNGAVLKRNLEYLHNEKGEELNGLKLSGKYLMSLELPGAELVGVDFSKSILGDAKLCEANLRDAFLKDAHLERANLENANLSWAYLDAVHLEWANLSEADLDGAHLEGAVLFNTHLRKAQLTEANLEKADLMEANLERANLRGAHLEGAHLVLNDPLKGNVEGVFLMRTFQLITKNLTQEQIDEAIGDRNTKLPPHLKMPSHWLEETEN